MTWFPIAFLMILNSDYCLWKGKSLCQVQNPAKFVAITFAQILLGNNASILPQLWVK